MKVVAEWSVARQSRYSVVAKGYDIACSRTPNHPTKTHRSDSEPRAWPPPPRRPGPCTTLPAPRLSLRDAFMCRLRRICVVDSLTHTHNGASYLPRPPSSLCGASPCDAPMPPHTQSPILLRSMWLDLLVCITEMCHLGAQVTHTHRPLRLQ
jgi:hypothetical protein